MKYVVETQGRDPRNPSNIRRYNYGDIASATLQYSRLKTRDDLHKVRLMVTLEETEVTR